MLVVTVEGKLQGLYMEVAEIARALQSLRGLLKTGHKQIFGDGDDGTEQNIENIIKDDVNFVNYDGHNCLMTNCIALKGSAGFAGPAIPP